MTEPTDAPPSLPSEEQIATWERAIAEVPTGIRSWASYDALDDLRQALPTLRALVARCREAEQRIENMMAEHKSPSKTGIVEFCRVHRLPLPLESGKQFDALTELCDNLNDSLIVAQHKLTEETSRAELAESKLAEVLEGEVDRIKWVEANDYDLNVAIRAKDAAEAKLRTLHAQVEALPMRDVITITPDSTRYEQHVSRSAVLALLRGEL